MKKFLLKLFAPFANEVWWPNWSNFRGRKAIKTCKVLEEDMVTNITEIRALVKKLYNKFKGTADNIKDLGDSITPPAQNYADYLNGLLEDDCDGFHSLVYHCLQTSGIRCYLMSVVSTDGGHCVLVFETKGKGYVNDYSKIYGSYNSLKEATTEYNKIFLDRYCNQEDAEVVYNGYIKYNYNKSKFKSVKKQLEYLLK